MRDSSLLRVHPHTGQTLVGFRLGTFLREWCASHAESPEEDRNLMESYLRSLSMEDAEPYMDLGFRRLFEDAREWGLNLDASFIRQNQS